MPGFDHPTILSPSFHGLHKERQWAPFCVLNTTKNALPIMSLAAYANETDNNSKVYFKQQQGFFVKKHMTGS